MSDGEHIFDKIRRRAETLKDDNEYAPNGEDTESIAYWKKAYLRECAENEALRGEIAQLKEKTRKLREEYGDAWHERFIK